MGSKIIVNEGSGGVKKLDRKAKALSKKVKSYTDATWSQDEKTRRAAFKARDEAQKKAVATHQRLGRKQGEGSMRPMMRAVEAGNKLMKSTPKNLKDRLTWKHGHKLKNKKVNELKKSLDSRNTLTRAQLDKESPEFKVSNVSKKKAEKGRGVNLSRKTMDTVDNTDASPKYVDATGNTKFARLKGWAKQMKDNRKDRKARRRVYNQVKSNTDEPSIIASKKDGSRHLVAGNTRATLRSTLGKPIKAHVFKEDAKPGLWANIHAKRKRGERAAKPGEKGYPKTLNIEGKSPAWQRKAGKNPEGGLNQKGVASYRAANPGSKLKTAVTTKPSKLKKGSNSAKRRKSFCARMSGMKKRLTSKKTANDPDSRINKSLRKWNC